MDLSDEAPRSVPTPRTPAGAAGLDALLADPARALVAVDYDGTLAPIVDDPASARAQAGAAAAVERVAGAVGTVAIITGRPAGVAVELAGLQAGAGNLLVLGHYGFERWDGQTGRVSTPPPPAGLALARQQLPDVLAAAGAPAGTVIEDKGLAVAVHVRRTADPASAMEVLNEPLARLASTSGLHLEPGRMVLELRPSGMDKGHALTALVAERGARAVLFAGDDLGDVAAFDAVGALRAQGIAGITVWSASPEVPSLAERTDLVVEGPAGIVAMLNGLADLLDG